MAETVEYIVRIVGLGGDDEEKKEKEKPSALASGLEGLQKALHPIQNALKHNKDEKAGAYFGKEVAKNVIGTMEVVATTSINRYFRLSEDYKGQNYLNNIMGNINRAKQFASGTIAGAAAGAKVGGGIGAIAGAALGGTTTFVKQAIQFQNTVMEFKNSLNATRIETAFRAERAGLYDGGKGTEN